MSRLIYLTNTSLDGYIADEAGDFDWPNIERLHPFFADLLRPVGTFLYGRRLYELMAYWDGPIENYPPEYRDFAQMWQVPEKVVFSRTLTNVTTRNTRIERDFNPESIRKIKEASERDILIGGAELASLAIEADLVDECQLVVHPVVLGGGKPAFRAGLRRNLELIESREPGIGALHLRYRVTRSSN